MMKLMKMTNMMKLMKKVRRLRFHSARLKPDLSDQELLSTQIWSGGESEQCSLSILCLFFTSHLPRFIINLGDGSNSSWSEYEQVEKVEDMHGHGFDDGGKDLDGV